MRRIPRRGVIFITALIFLMLVASEPVAAVSLTPIVDGTIRDGLHSPKDGVPDSVIGNSVVQALDVDRPSLPFEDRGIIEFTVSSLSQPTTIRMNGPFVAFNSLEYPPAANLIVTAGPVPVPDITVTDSVLPDDDIEVTISSQGNTLRLIEKEILTTPCDCMCCYNVYSEIAGLTSGEYTIEVCWQDWETHGELCKTVEVIVP